MRQNTVTEDGQCTMDVAAELTLQIASFLQTESDAPRSPARWVFVPGPGPRARTFAEAAACLAAIDKPVVVGALNQPGCVALWQAAALDETERQHVEHTLANQQEGLSEVLPQFGAGEADIVVFEGWGVKVDVPVSALRVWVGEYALTWGWRLGRPTDDTHCARLIVFHSGRRWSPGGIRPAPGAA